MIDGYGDVATIAVDRDRRSYYASGPGAPAMVRRRRSRAPKFPLQGPVVAVGQPFRKTIPDRAAQRRTSRWRWLANAGNRGDAS